MPIVPGDWQQMVRECHPDDLHHWHARWRDIDWSATLAQPHWHLITDGQGSWCLIEPVNGSAQHREGHLIIAPHRRGKAGLVIARDMLVWIEAHGIASLIANAHDRATALFLRWLGFGATEGKTMVMRFDSGPSEEQPSRS